MGRGEMPCSQIVRDEQKKTFDDENEVVYWDRRCTDSAKQKNNHDLLANVGLWLTLFESNYRINSVTFHFLNVEKPILIGNVFPR